MWSVALRLWITQVPPAASTAALYFTWKLFVYATFNVFVANDVIAPSLAKILYVYVPLFSDPWESAWNLNVPEDAGEWIIFTIHLMFT